VWTGAQRAVVITRDRLAFLWPGLLQPLSLIGEGPESLLKFTGPLTTALFGFQDEVSPAEDHRGGPISSERIGRNAPCPCGSGKKFKKCHGA
jgi:hypothetical protein